MQPLALIFGAVIGFSLGLTGGGGSILAVPMLVYGLKVPAAEAVGISLAAVGATALFGAIQRMRRFEVDISTGLLFAVAGMIGAPAGSMLGRRLPESLLLVSFAVLMLWVAARMWLTAAKKPQDAAVLRAEFDAVQAKSDGPACRRDSQGRLPMNSRCAVVLVFVGLLTGVLSGLFGVGGGFVIVPALVLLTGMSIQRAVATSLLVIALVSASGIIAYASSRHLQAQLTLLFIAGGLGGLVIGTATGRKLSPVMLQKVFSVVIVAVAFFVVMKNVT